jgi:NADH:ubiquinone reductase (H+-translocating)
MRWRRGRRPASPQGPRVIVVGAGFAGLSAVGALAGSGAQVMLIDQNVYSTFQPLLYQVATAGLNPGDVAYPVRGFTRKLGARFRLGELTDVDTVAQRVTLADGGQYSYDYLVLATGVTAAYYGVTGAAEHTRALYTRRDAISLRDHIMAWLERLDVDGPGKDINFTVVGGGATGVELAGTLAELRSTALDAAFPEIDNRNVRIRLVEQAPSLLAPFHPALQRYAYQQLLDRGVEVRLNAKIREVTADEVLLDSGEELPSDITVWAAGITAPPVIGHWGLPQGRGGRIEVGPDLRVRGLPNVFAAGDIALVDDQPLPQLAQPAIQGGRHAARQIRRLIAGQRTEPLRYHDKGIMATIGFSDAIAELPRGIKFKGVIAWLSWIGLHVVTLIGNRNRFATMVNLSVRYFTWPRSLNIVVGDPADWQADRA